MKPKINMDELCKLFGVDTPDTWTDHWYDNDTGESYSYVIRNGGTEEQAMDAEQAEMEEAFRRYFDAVMAVADNLFREHGLELVAKGKHRCPWEYYVVPVVSWKDSAGKIITTINGVGMFEFSSVREFLSSGPYTPCQGVMSHLHWIADFPRVYGSGTARSMVDRALSRH